MKEQKELKLGLIGLGGRGYSILEDILCLMEGIKIVHVCDVYEDRAQRARDCVIKLNGNIPKITVEYMEVINDPEVEVVIIMSAWENHIPATIAAMRAGKHVGCEVGGAYALEDCWDLIRAYEETGNHAMLMENCCYGRDELMVLNMVKQGLFGKVVYCEGGYHHDLREEVCYGRENRHYRLRNYQNRCCENYPTHELGPIAKVLGINRGNRMISLTSMATGAWGLNDYARLHEGVDPALRDYSFKQGDIVKTTIKCAGGELITLTLDTTLPRNYNRGFTVRGTLGGYNEWEKAVFLDSLGEEGNRKYENREMYYEEYEHPIWKRYQEEGIRGSHDGMDWLLYEAFFEGIRSGEQPAIDTYDMAAWMAITPLSEASIARGGAPMEIPDFTRGKWINRTDGNHTQFSLETY